MGTPNFTVVLGIDAKHLRQLALVYPTWEKHKSKSLGLDGSRPLVVFYERGQVRPGDIWRIVKHPDLCIYAWPPPGVSFLGDDTSKWENRQRHKMLSGFVHMPAAEVATPYFLKLDTDAVAVGMEDWIDPAWFDNHPALVGHPWGFTRPADQMLRLDKWAATHLDLLDMFRGTEPLRLAPKPGEERVRHRRIEGWCTFIDTEFNRQCATAASLTCGRYQLPVASQDGFLFYCAKRAGRGIVRTSMKKCGWAIWSTFFNISRAAEKALRA